MRSNHEVIFDLINAYRYNLRKITIHYLSSDIRRVFYIAERVFWFRHGCVLYLYDSLDKYVFYVLLLNN